MCAAAALLAALSPLVLGSGCSGGEVRFREAYAAAAAGKQGAELRGALVALDQQYPRQLQLKVNLGALCLAAGDLRAAAAYLERGERLAAAPRFAGDKRLRYLLQANLAELRLRSGAFEDSAAHADRALALSVPDEVGVVLTRAKARLAAGHSGEALADFAQGRAAGLDMNLEDYGAWIRALVSAGRPAEALSALEERRRAFGYLSGQGLEESLLYERLGRTQEAVLSAFLELEHRRGGGAQDDAALRGNLQRLARRFRAEQTAQSAAALRLVAGLDRYLAGQWAPAEESLREVRVPEPHVGLEYLLLALRLEQGAGPAELVSYTRLEPQLRSLAAYYYHLWRGLRGSGGSYAFATARPVLEKTILLGPEGHFARESRAEIGRLLGLSASQGERLLLVQEAQELVRQAAAEGRPEALEPLLAALELPETPYTAETLLLLREALAVPLLRQQLERRAAAAQGRLGERLGALLGR